MAEIGGTITGDTAALEGVRVLEYTAALAGRTAGSLLADLGADVVRFPVDGRRAGRSEPAAVWSDRAKAVRGVGWADQRRVGELRRLAGAADVFLADLPPGGLERFGLDATTLRGRHRLLVHAWMPPYGTCGRWSYLDADPLLLSAVSGYSDNIPASQDRPVAPAVPTFAYLQGGMGAAAVLAALVGRERNGSGHSLCVSGLDAMGAALGTLMMHGLDVEGLPSVGRSLRMSPSFRLYQGGDGAWFFLAALTPSIFIRALEALGRMDLLVRDDVGGEFANFMAPGVKDAVNDEMERTLASRPAAEWLEVLRAADVPAAPVWSRQQWIDAAIVPAARREAIRHEEFGVLSVPAPPVVLPLTPMRSAVRSGPAGGWDGRPVTAAAGPATADGPGGPGPDGPGPGAPGADEAGAALPLAGVKVVDFCSFLAGPFASSLLADFGAEVIKVEPADGDPYAVFTVSHTVVNQAKQVIGLDLRDDAARRTFLRIVAGAEVMVDNFMPDSLEKMDLGVDTVAAANPSLVRCSVSAFGPDNPWSSTPGFDPVLQSMTGLAVAQGGAGSPVQTSAPVVDVTAGTLAAVGCLAALLVRIRTGRVQHARTSLASAAVFVQSGEMTGYEGCPPPAPGSLDYLGPAPARRLYPAADGWLAVSAAGDGEDRFYACIDQPAGTPQPPGDEVERRIAGRGVDEWLDAFSAAGVPAARVLRRDRAICDPYLAENGFSHLVEVPAMGRFRIVDSFSRWNGTRRAPGRFPDRAAATAEVLGAAGLSAAEIDDMVARRVVSGPARSGPPPSSV